MSEPVRYLGLDADQFFLKFTSLADVRSYINYVAAKPDEYGISSENAARATAWLKDFLSFKFEDEPFSLYSQVKEYQFCGITLPVHSPLESLVYALSLVEPPGQVAERDWCEVWALCVARLVGVVSPAQAPVRLSLMYPSPQFKLPATWNSKYLIGISMAMRLIDLSGQLLLNLEEAQERRNKIQKERHQFAVKCATEGRAKSMDPIAFDPKLGVQPIVGLCATHIPSCIILGTVSRGKAAQFERVVVKVERVVKTDDASMLKREDYLAGLFQQTCINCVDGRCVPAGLAAANQSKQSSNSDWIKKFLRHF